MIAELLDHQFYRDFHGENKQKILKYIILCYKKQKNPSTLTAEEFKAKALKDAGIAKNSQLADELVNLKNPDYNELITYYLQKVQNDDFYESLVSHQHMFWDIMERMREPIARNAFTADPDKLYRAYDLKGKLSDLSEALLNRIAALKNKVYQQHMDIQEIHEQSIRKARLSPETVSEVYVSKDEI